MEDFLDAKKSYPNLKFNSRHKKKDINNFVDYITNQDQRLQYQMVLASLEEDVEQYRRLVKRKYGEPTKRDTQEIVNYLRLRSHKTKKKQNYENLVANLDSSVTATKSIHAPSEQVFQHYRILFKKIYESELQDISDCIRIGKSYKKVADDLVARFGYNKEGWKAITAKRGNGVYVLGGKKRLVVPNKKKVVKLKRTKAVFAHEILVHIVRRRKNLTYHVKEEGLGVLVEQLILPVFIYKRAIRYFAIAVAWGVDGKRRDFRESYDLVYDMVRIIDFHQDRKAQEVAFFETARAFSGSNTKIPGFVMTKDIAYFRENMAVWRKLEEYLLDQNEFKKLIEGE